MSESEAVLGSHAIISQTSASVYGMLITHYHLFRAVPAYPGTRHDDFICQTEDDRNTETFGVSEYLQIKS